MLMAKIYFLSFFEIYDHVISKPRHSNQPPYTTTTPWPGIKP